MKYIKYQVRADVLIVYVGDLMNKFLRKNAKHSIFFCMEFNLCPFHNIKDSHSLCCPDVAGFFLHHELPILRQYEILRGLN